MRNFRKEKKVKQTFFQIFFLINAILYCLALV